ncbi:OPT oligopeptide transporter [Dacryopinax primogenitus]|uniref:OPT oligopeptide transporter n=1 Tax=Dacryopinax primogenitus (strain DJM 731) TaxID=1858805 RepID=M5G1U3_DACPD|nr:OPT oligopeptide transporter [Dacryopinax primogenitus]EJT99866.1 OPT oligopeptide transporter [Dacryopinax primogenitus]
MDNTYQPDILEYSPDLEGNIPVNQAQHLREDVAEHHLNDPNYYVQEHIQLHRVHRSTEKMTDFSSIDDRVAVEIENDLEDDSPYPEVRAAVSNTDDPTMPVNTFRTWFLGLLFTIVISGLNQFFSLRIPSVTITALVAQLVALPCGKFLERTLPTRKFHTFGYEWSFNPGPFNIKEHTVITVMANVVYGGAYATDILITQTVFYGETLPVGYQLLLVISTQMIGFSFAGICRRWLVWPSSMIFPSTLVNTALFNTLHSTYGHDDKGRISREKFFLLAFLCSFLWYFFPGYIFAALSYFNWICWIAPNNFIVNALFGFNSGLGMSIITFDWAQVTYTGSPLVSPWWAEANVFAAVVIVYWLVCPIMYFTNTFFGGFLPMVSGSSWDNTGAEYDATRIIVDGVFQEELYQQYSPLYLSTSFTLAYGLSFAALTSTIVHTFLWYRHDIIRQFRASLKDESDIHSRLMCAYKEVPHWWYAALGVISLVCGIVCIEVYDTKLPVWAFFVALGIALIYLIPVGMIQAITNQQVGLNVITELIVGYAVPGRPVAMMIFKTFGYITMSQALAFVSDLKLGHYMKIPPRLMFTAQVVAGLLACFIVVGVQDWMLGNIDGICTPEQKDHFSCPNSRVFGTASLIWGGIGPQRIFSKGAVYYPLVYFFLIGAILPIPFWLLAKKYPQSWFKYVNIPVFFTGPGYMPPATPINYAAWFVVGTFFQYFMRRYHFTWWSRYNYILSAALDSGLAISTIVIFFALSFPAHGTIGADNLALWWGNTVFLNTIDFAGTPHLALPETGYFGVPQGSWT